jgi:hypothetical protein
MTPIERRILDAVIKMVRVRKWRPKVIYLKPEDYAEWHRARYGRGGVEFVDVIEVRQGKVSRLIPDHYHSGVSI